MGETVRQSMEKSKLSSSGKCQQEESLVMLLLGPTRHAAGLSRICSLMRKCLLASCKMDKVSMHVRCTDHKGELAVPSLVSSGTTWSLVAANHQQASHHTA